jgi:hypothetical protein
MAKQKMHIWPDEGTLHPVGKKHKKGKTHWNKTKIVKAKNKYKEGV